VDGRVGVVFNISERYMLGSLSMLTVGMAPHEMYGTMQRVLTFISTKEREVEAANDTRSR
jgi:type III secretion system FlhB-like substrate exporter